MVNVMDLFRLDGKVIVATGATGYLCSHFVEAVAQAGGSLAMIDIPSNVDKLKELAQSLKNQYGIEVRYYMADNSKEADIQKVSEQIIQDFGHIDGLINAAGVNQHGSIQDYTGEDYARLMNINIVGTFYVVNILDNIWLNKNRGLL